MNRVIHLISDLHLCESQPHLSALLEQYLQEIAPACDHLFILGDLFEMWVGDDNHCEYNQKIIRMLADFSDQFGTLFIGHGNRDFLLGDAFAKSIGATLITEPYNCQWNSHQVCLMHGDSLCTDDVKYQEFRSMVRDPLWQQQFLGQPLATRLAYAENVRQQSKAQQLIKSAEIMDVNQQAVVECILENNCDWLIHGHTHREGMHSIDMPDKSQAKRIVLSDWGKRGHYLEVSNDKITSNYFDMQNINHS